MTLLERSARLERADAPAAPAGAEAPRPLTLVEQAAEMAPRGAETAAEEAETERTVCADGYLRRSPVQAYRTGERRGRWRRALVWAAVIAVAALTVLALLKSGLLRL